jgi:BolA family transcriptional regulator, general stress-responsive regulator
MTAVVNPCEPLGFAWKRRVTATEKTTMSIATLLERSLTEAFSPERLIVTDESAAHAGHAGHRPGGESHFRVRIVSGSFAGLSRLERHRRVNEAARPAFAAGVHALAIEAVAPSEPTSW